MFAFLTFPESHRSRISRVSRHTIQFLLPFYASEQLIKIIHVRYCTLCINAVSFRSFEIYCLIKLIEVLWNQIHVVSNYIIFKDNFCLQKEDCFCSLKENVIKLVCTILVNSRILTCKNILTKN